MTNILKVLLEISITASVMILVVMAIRAVFSKKMNPVIVTMLWAVVLLRLCVPVTIQSPIHLSDLIPEKLITSAVSEADTAVETSYTLQEPTMTTEQIAPEKLPGQQNGSVKKDISELTFFERIGRIIPDISWSGMFAAVWIFGVLVVLLLTLRRGMLFRRRLRNCKHISDSEILELVRQHKLSLHVKRRITLIECSDGATPAVFGYFKPYIIMPTAFMKGMDINKINCILLHEICHIKRHDILKSYAWLVAKAVHWFNPLVWIAYKMVKDDIELCCDGMVLRELEDKRYEYTQSLIDVFRLAKKMSAFAVTVSLFENRTKLVERVMRMLKPYKKSKLALAATIVLAVIMIAACFTTACQTVPEAQEAVVTDDEPQAIAHTAEPTHNESITQVSTMDNKPTYEVPERWTENFEQKGSVLKINIDADIVVPNTDTFSVYNVDQNGKISQEMADRMIKVFFGDTPVYESTPPLHEELEKWLDVLKKEFAAMKDGTFDYTRCDIEDKETVMNETKRDIYSLEYQIDQMQDEVDFIPLNTSITSGEISGEADLGEAERASIIIRNENVRFTNLLFQNNGDYAVPAFGIDNEAPLPGLAISEAEAVKRAKNLLSELGIESFEERSTYISRRFTCPKYQLIYDDAYAYNIIFTKVVDEMPLSQHIAYYKQDEELMQKQAQYLTPECIVITLDDDGIRRFYWQAMFEIKKKAEKNVKLIPFSDIKDIIAEQPFIKYDFVGDDNKDGIDPLLPVTESLIKNVHTIKLEMARMPIDGNMEEQQLVPVWNVYASSETKERYKEDDGSLKTLIEILEIPNIMLTINAIDGSVI